MSNRRHGQEKSHLSNTAISRQAADQMAGVYHTLATQSRAGTYDMDGGGEDEGGPFRWAAHITVSYTQESGAFGCVRWTMKTYANGQCVTIVDNIAGRQNGLAPWVTASTTEWEGDGILCGRCATVNFGSNPTAAQDKDWDIPPDRQPPMDAAGSAEHVRALIEDLAQQLPPLWATQPS